MRWARWVICLGFAAAGLLLALLPFVAVEDNPLDRVPTLTWTGYSLIAGAPGPLHLEADGFLRSHPGAQPTETDPQRAAFLDQFANVVDPPVRPQPLVMGAALFIVAGFAGGLLLGAASRRLVFAVAGLGGAVTLVVAELRIMNRLSATPNFGMGPPMPAYGFWIVGGLLLVLGVAGTVLSARGLMKGEQRGRQNQ